MRVVCLEQSIRPSLIQGEAPQPRPGRGELLIRVCAAGVTLTELSWYPTTHDKAGRARSGAIPSHEFSGVVEAVGEDVGALEIGREVYGMNDWYCNGAMADYCIAPFFTVAPKPQNLTHVQAASVPIGALTAWQGLFVWAGLKAGERLLIHGGAGAVGSFAVQLARLHGAHVIATASSRNLGLAGSLGAEEVIDYRTAQFEDTVRPVDVVFDTVGGDTIDRSWSVLKPGGRLVTVVSTAAESVDPRVRKAFFIVEPDQKQLYEIAALLDGGKLRAVVDSVVPLSCAPDLFGGRVERKGRGKVVIAVAN
jgi:NADPH:quinone reductase-like Zn-dependent oxidoreductase